LLPLPPFERLAPNRITLGRLAVSDRSSPGVFHFVSLKTPCELIYLIPVSFIAEESSFSFPHCLFLFVYSTIDSLIFSCHASYCRSEATAGLVKVEIFGSLSQDIVRQAGPERNPN
jgi:hypothetical protein